MKRKESTRRDRALFGTAFGLVPAVGSLLGIKTSDTRGDLALALTVFAVGFVVAYVAMAIVGALVDDADVVDGD
jgi:hypothetical protein